MNDLWSDLEAACGSIKHCPETVDLDDVRALLRRCQYEITTLRDLMAAATFPGDAVLRAIDEVAGD